MQFNFRYNLTLRKPIGNQRTELGTAIETTEDINTQAALISSAGRETDSTNVILPENTRQFIIRERPDINTSWTVVYQNQIHNIIAIDPIISRDRNHFLKLICKATETTYTQNIPVVVKLPVFFLIQNTIPGPPSSLHAYDVAGKKTFSLEKPDTDDSVAIVINPPVMGNFIIFLYPRKWNPPVGYYAGSDTSLNQIGAFYFANAVVNGVEVDNPNYKALISRNRKLTDSGINDRVVW